MKVTCEYCGSYVEADENMKCPLCNAALGTAVRTEQQHIEQQEVIAYQREAEAKAQEAKEEHISEVITGVANVATALAAGAGLSGVLGPSSSDANEHRPPEPPDDRRMPPPPHHGEGHDADDTGLFGRISSAASRAADGISGSREKHHRPDGDHDRRMRPDEPGAPRGDGFGGGPSGAPRGDGFGGGRTGGDPRGGGRTGGGARHTGSRLR